MGKCNSLRRTCACIFTLSRKLGGSEHLKAIIYMMQDASENRDINYYHIISGDDWPVRSLDEIYEHYNDCDDIDILCTKISEMTDSWYKKSVPWQKYYSFLDVFNYKSTPQKILVKASVLLQRLLKVNRLKQLDVELAQGLIWGSIPRDALLYCMDYIHKDPEFMEFMTYGHASEEFFFQTILSNSSKYKSRITKKNHRYYVYEWKNGSYPGILDESNYERIVDSDAFFARKIDSNISRRLIELLENNNY